MMNLKERHERKEREMVDSVLNHARDGWIAYSELVRGMFGSGDWIDEMAFLFYDEAAVAAFVKKVVQREGYELFNVAEDSVECGPIPAYYNVGYWFLRTPFNYRLELMSLYGGYSPVHSAVKLDPDQGETTVIGVHASFKTLDQDHYATVNVVLRKEGWECAQRCESTYGRFSYWNHPDHEGWFLKPRVNLRDTKKVTSNE